MPQMLMTRKMKGTKILLNSGTVHLKKEKSVEDAQTISLRMKGTLPTVSSGCRDEFPGHFWTSAHM